VVSGIVRIASGRASTPAIAAIVSLKSRPGGLDRSVSRIGCRERFWSPDVNYTKMECLHRHGKYNLMSFVK